MAKAGGTVVEVRSEPSGCQERCQVDGACWLICRREAMDSSGHTFRGSRSSGLGDRLCLIGVGGKG